MKKKTTVASKAPSASSKVTAMTTKTAVRRQVSMNIESEKARAKLPSPTKRSISGSIGLYSCSAVQTAKPVG